MSKGDPLDTQHQTDGGYPHQLFLQHSAFLTEVLNLEITDHDKENEFLPFKLPSGEILEVFGSKNLWHPFTTTPDWEVILADVQNRQEKTAHRNDK